MVWMVVDGVGWFCMVLYVMCVLDVGVMAATGVAFVHRGSPLPCGGGMGWMKQLAGAALPLDRSPFAIPIADSHKEFDGGLHASQL